MIAFSITKKAATVAAWTGYQNCSETNNLGARARAGGPASRGLPGPARPGARRARPVARWPLVLSVSVPDGECIVVVGIVWSACAALRDSLLATHGTAWNQTRASASRVGALARMPDARARMGEAGAARRGHQDGLPRCSGRETETAARASRARPLTAPVS